MHTHQNVASRRDNSHVYRIQFRRLDKLDKQTISFLLNVLQKKLLKRRGKQTTLVVHGGVLSVFCGIRQHTATIDYIAGALPEELVATTGEGRSTSLIRQTTRSTNFDMKETRTIIKECITETANDYNANVGKRYGYCLERDWMNAYGDMVLPATLQ